jgi:hypothetical protein
MAEMIGAWEAARQEYESGIVDVIPMQNQSRAHILLLRAPGGRRWWDKYRDTYPPTFRDFVETQIETPAD